jgi:hypothetical protein
MLWQQWSDPLPLLVSQLLIHHPNPHPENPGEV